MPRQVSGVRCLALGSGDRLFIGTVDNNIWSTSLNGDLDSPLKGSGANLVKIMEVSSTSLCISTRKPEKPEILVGNSHETLENLGYRLYSDQPFPFFFLFAVNPCINTISQNWSYAYQRILSIKLTVKRTNAGRRRHFFFFAQIWLFLTCSKLSQTLYQFCFVIFCFCRWENTFAYWFA